jgi:hypothetical protein
MHSLYFEISLQYVKDKKQVYKINTTEKHLFMKITPERAWKKKQRKIKLNYSLAVGVKNIRNG